MTGKAVFLSAGLPDPSKPHFVAASDPVDVAAAVKALLFVVLGRRRLIWGGQPAITPIVWSVAQSLGVDYRDWVTLYQSEYFADRYPEDNARFENTRYVAAAPEIAGQSEDERRRASLLAMRTAMLTENGFETAIFVGGMLGIVDEFELVGELCPAARRIPVLSTGGATALLGERLGPNAANLDRLRSDVDYVPLFFELCEIDPMEPRG